MKIYTTTTKHATVTVTRNEDGSLLSQSSADFDHHRKHNSFSGTTNGDFVHENAFTRTSYEITAPLGVSSGTITSKRTSTTSGVLGYIPTALIASSRYTGGYAQSDFAAQTALSEKLRGSLDLLVDATQARQTVQMLRLANTASDLWRTFKRNPFKAIASARLQWQYGWLPTMGSIYSLTERMLETARTDGYSVKARGTYTSRGSSAVAALWGTKYLPINDPNDYKVVTEYRCRFTVPSASQILSMYTSLNPASIAWENIPFSFVGDWFYNVGGYLRNLETAYLYDSTFAGGARTRSYKAKGFYTISGYVPGTLNTITSGTGRYASNGHTRTILTSFPIPQKPSVNLDLSSGRLLNLAALITSFTKG